MATATATTKQVTNDDGETSDVPAVEVTAPVRLDQLDAEVTDAMNWRKQAGLQAEGDIFNPSPESPVVLTVARDDIDPAVFLAAVQAHHPDPAWVDPDVTLPSFEDAKQRLRANQVLSAQDVAALLRGLIGDEDAPTP
jgi:hypothetical protein